MVVPATLDQILSPDDLTRVERDGAVEFLDGRIVEKPVTIESCGIVVVIGTLLANQAKASKSAHVLGSSMGYQCFSADPMRIRKSDVSLVRSERFREIDPQDRFMPIPADLAVEVLCDKVLAYEIAAKLDEYLRNGFALIWVVQPNTRTVQIFRADGSVQVLHEQDEITGESALPGFRCKVAEFFQS